MPSGILIIDKPAGWTSMDVCAKAVSYTHLTLPTTSRV